tara:strand:- start:1235 stop:1861 length:627 start_codon:yes stop_codon:yes gene_type:complete
LKKFLIRNINENYIVSLCAIFQSCSLVERAATSSVSLNDHHTTMIKSITANNNDHYENIYGDKYSLMDGATTLRKVLYGNSEDSIINIQKYIVSLITIQNKLSKSEVLVKGVKEKIDDIRNKGMDKNIDEQVSYHAMIYKEYISCIKPRIIILGQSKYLEENASLIRTLLLSGIRASILWYYADGSKWHLIFSRKQILNALNLIYKTQ